ncbi:hypothetical protein [Neisseria sp. Ec49-e6-T10]|uniref:hypothetical protein n=1 Tax=Neisseria sp. Ec49-e6-T10 TaxID=3140744 RepID=UPI003EBF3591
MKKMELIVITSIALNMSYVNADTVIIKTSTETDHYLTQRDNQNQKYNKNLAHFSLIPSIVDTDTVLINTSAQTNNYLTQRDNQSQEYNKSLTHIFQSERYDPSEPAWSIKNFKSNK